MLESEHASQGFDSVVGRADDDRMPLSRASEFQATRTDGASVSMPAAFTRFLMRRPSLEDVVKFLVGLLCAPAGVLGAAIAFTNKAQTVTVAQYVDLVPGWHLQVETDLLSARVADSRPMGPGRVISTPWTDPDALPGQKATIWPLARSGASGYSLVLLHATHLDEPQLVRQVSEVADTLGVYLITAQHKTH